jgi:hypothetical protein
MSQLGYVFEYLSLFYVCEIPKIVGPFYMGIELTSYAFLTRKVTCQSRNLEMLNVSNHHWGGGGGGIF